VSLAQITVTTDNNPQTGDSFTQHIASGLDKSFNAGASGENVTWDFSSLQSGSTVPVDIEENTSGDYPQANIFFEQQGASTYFGTDANAFTFYGTASSGVSIVYSDGQDQMRFPFTYGDSYSDTFLGTIEIFGQTFDREGTVDVTSDGYGTLMTPQGTYENSLRMRIVRNSEESAFGQVTATTTDTIYFWYEENTSFPIATYFRNYSDGDFTGQSFNYLDDGSVSIEDHEKLTASIYPNPAAEEVKIEGLENEDFTIEVIDLSGKVLREGRNSESVDVSEFESGIYLIRISAEGNRQKVLKLVKD
jgi:hypothetical protein